MFKSYDAIIHMFPNYKLQHIQTVSRLNKHVVVNKQKPDISYSTCELNKFAKYPRKSNKTISLVECVEG